MFLVLLGVGVETVGTCCNNFRLSLVGIMGKPEHAMTI